MAKRKRRRKRRHRSSARNSLASMLGVRYLLISVVLVGGSLLNKCDATISSTSDDNSSVILKTQHGHLFRGLKLFPSSSSTSSSGGGGDADLVAFMGIRYASAPVRRLRFMPPTPFNYALGQVHDARQFGPICMQKFPGVQLTSTHLSHMQALKLKLKLKFKEQSQQAHTTTTHTNKSSINNDHQTLSTKQQLVELQMRLTNKLASINGKQLLFASDARRLLVSMQNADLFEYEQSEDCLSLNIFVPIQALQENRIIATHNNNHDQQQQLATAQSQESANKLSTSNDTQAKGELDKQTKSMLLPVLVLIHGDSFEFGAGRSLNAIEFARKHKVLVVTLNYRLNLFGFPPKSSGASRTNLGLLDQVAALHWLQANVRSFGGQTQNITLFGKHMGAVFVHLLMLSPLARGLFQRAVVEDGTALSPIVVGANIAPIQHQAAMQHLQALAHWTQCAPNNTDNNNNNNLLECLKLNASPYALVRSPLASALGRFQAPPSNALVIADEWREHVDALLTPLVASGDGGELEFVQSLLANRTLESRDHLDQFVALLVIVHENELSSDLMRKISLQLLGAIYLQANESTAFVYAPQLDSSSVPNDLMSAMLQRDSAFGMRDFLVGVSHPLTHESDKLNVAQDLISNNYDDDNHHHYEQLVVEQINTFVRSFYRFHQQEIANSIVNHYLNNNNKIKQAQLDSAHERQLLLRNLLAKLLQDALVDVPLIKTALVHSLAQLEHVADLFVASRQLSFSVATPNNNNNNATSNSSQLTSDFHHFAQALLHDAQRQQRDNNNNNKFLTNLVRSTHLYQFDDSSNILAQLARASRLVNNNDNLINKQLATSLDKLATSKSARAMLNEQLGFGCAFVALQTGKEHRGSQLNTPLQLIANSLCERSSKHLANFVKFGRVEIDTSDTSDESSDLCRSESSADHLVTLTSAPDEVAASSSDEIILISDGGRKCTRNPFEQLLHDTIARAPAGEWPAFNVFTQSIGTLFASSSASLNHNADHLMMSVLGENLFAREQQQQVVDATNGRKLAAQLTFWSNFIPALNCARTQPLGATLLLSFAHANSTLLSMNLNPNGCQQQSSTTRQLTTAQQVMQSIETRIVQQIDELHERARQQQQQREVKNNNQQRAHTRMAQQAAAAARDDSTLDQEQDDNNTKLVQTSAQLNGSQPLDWLTASDAKSLAPQLAHHWQHSAWLLILSGAGGVGGIALVLVVGVLIIVVVVRKRMNYQRSSKLNDDVKHNEQPNVHTISSSSSSACQVPCAPQLDCTSTSFMAIQHQHNSTSENEQLEHLPNCNLLQQLIQQQQQQHNELTPATQMLSSSSETTTTNRAQSSSVSLVSAAITTVPNNNSGGVKKKRVKISVPSGAEMDCFAELTHEQQATIYDQEETNEQRQRQELYLNANGFVSPNDISTLASYNEQYNFTCPLHRSTSGSLLASQSDAYGDVLLAGNTFLQTTNSNSYDMQLDGLQQLDAQQLMIHKRQHSQSGADSACGRGRRRRRNQAVTKAQNNGSLTRTHNKTSRTLVALDIDDCIQVPPPPPPSKPLPNQQYNEYFYPLKQNTFVD